MYKIFITSGRLRVVFENKLKHTFKKLKPKSGQFKYYLIPSKTEATIREQVFGDIRKKKGISDIRQIERIMRLANT
jgi:hypothetical protein